MRLSRCSWEPRGSSLDRASSRARTRPEWPTRSSRRRPISTTRPCWPRSARVWARRCRGSAWNPFRTRSGWPSGAGSPEQAAPMKIGVLAVQGDFLEHVRTYRAIGVEAVEVRLPEDLEGVSGLTLPGGESTAMRRLIDRWGLRQPILDLAESGAPIFGTWAGMILLAREISGGEEPVLPLLDVADLGVPMLGDEPVHGVFIRAPVITRVGSGVDVLARLDDGRIVAVVEAGQD